MKKISMLLLSAVIYTATPAFAMDSQELEAEKLTARGYKRDGVTLYRDGKTTEEDLQLISKLTHLEKLSFISADLKDSDISNLRNLTNLTFLELRYNPSLTDNCLSHLQTLTRLKELRLGQEVIQSDMNSITWDGLKQLTSLINLEYIGFTCGYPEGLLELGGKSTWPNLKKTY